VAGGVSKFTSSGALRNSFQELPQATHEGSDRNDGDACQSLDSTERCLIQEQLGDRAQII
jgi:hypothetical protein